MNAAATRPDAQAFDPAGWLDAFAQAGGWWAVTDGRLWFGWPADPVEQATAVREVYRDIEAQPDRMVAVRAALAGGS